MVDEIHELSKGGVIPEVIPLKTWIYEWWKPLPGGKWQQIVFTTSPKTGEIEILVHQEWPCDISPFVMMKNGATITWNSDDDDRYEGLDSISFQEELQ